VVVDGGTVSRQHARLWLEDGIVAVEDLGSRNGVKINGVRTRSGSLHDGDQLEVGQHLFVVTTPDAPSVSVKSGDVPTPTPIPKARGTQKRALQNPDVRLNAALASAARLQPYLFDSDVMFKHMAKIILSGIPGQRCYILGNTPGKRDLNVLYFATRSGIEDGPGLNTAIVEHVYSQRKPIISGDVSEAPTTRAAETSKTGTICVPLMSNKNAIGAIYVDTGWESSRFVQANLEDMKAYGLAFGTIVDQAGQIDAKIEDASAEGINEATSALGKCFYEQLHDLREAMQSGKPDALDEAMKRADLAVQQMVGIASIQHARPRSLPLNALMDKVLSEMAAEIKAAGVTVDFPNNTRAIAFVDAYQLERVIYALLMQSLSTCTSGSNTVSILTENRPDGCYIIIKDDGAGLPAGQAAGLSSNVLDNVALGMRGIMLANAFGVIEAHNGSFTIRSEENAGSLFTVVLPQQESAVANQ
ncbi:MAG: FHA domain-containing protein, partial [Candidatus Hydrogenedentota bacterium]